VTALPVLCCPPAGAGPSFFNAWTRASGLLRIVPVELPGRERRFTEPLHTDLATLLPQLLHELDPAIVRAPRLVVFGHSFGAVLGYELVHALRARDRAQRLVLVASGSPEPGTPRPGRLTGLPDDEFVATLRRITGHHDPALDDPELRQLVLPIVRADVEAHERYRPHAGREPLDVPVVAARGRRDALVSAGELAGWAAVTTGEFRAVEFDGGHMYPVDGWRRVLRLLESVLFAPVVAR